MALDKCDDAIKTAVGLTRELTDEESRIIKQRAAELAKKIKNADDPAELNDVLKKFGDDVAFNRALQKRNTALQYAAFAKLEAWRKNTPFAINNPAEAFKGFMRGSLRNFEGAKNSLTNLVQRESNARSGAFLADLENSGLKKYAFDGGDDMNITRAWSDIKNGIEPDAAKYGKNAVTAAQLFDKHLEAIRQGQNRAGAWIARAADRLWRRTHDANKIARAGGNSYGSLAGGARDYWVNSVSSKLDWAKSFDGNYSEATTNVRNTLLHSLWNDFKNNDHYKPGEAVPPVGLGTSNLAKKLSHGRQLIFNSADDEYAYNKEFGTGSSVAENVFHNLAGGGRDLALLRKLGPNPETTLNRFIKSWRNDAEAEDSSYSGDQQKLLKEMTEKEMANTWKLLSGGAGHASDNFVGRFAAAVRTTTNVAALGMSVFKLPNDLALRSRMVAQRTGGSFAATLLRTTSDMFTGTGISKAERQQLFAELGLRTEGVNMPLDPNTMDGIGFGHLAKFNQQVMSVTGHAWWDNKFRLNALVADGYRHWTQRNLSFDQLNKSQQNAYKQFGIDEKGWDIIRQSEGTQLSTGMNVFMPSDIEAMPLDKFKSLVNNPNASDMVLSRARDSLMENYRNYVGELADRGTSAPSIANRAFMGMGKYKEGTIPGELYRGALQLKGWAANYLRNHLGDELFGHDNQPATFGQAMADLLKGKNPKGFMGLAKLISTGFIISEITNAMHDVASGKSPEDPLSKAGILRAVASGSLGIYADFLLQDSNPDASFFDKLGDETGPEFGLVSDLFNIGHRTIEQLSSTDGLTPEKIGNDERELFQSLYHHTPGTSLFWTKATMDYFILNNLSEQLNPGYQQRLIERNQKAGQTFLGGAPGPQTNGQ